MAEQTRARGDQSSSWRFVISFSLVFLTVFSVIVSAVLSWPLTDGSWFQRSGSLCVLFCVLLEIHQASLKKPVPASSVFTEGMPTMRGPNVSSLDNWLHRFAWLGIVLGTLIWGYGDLALPLLLPS